MGAFAGRWRITETDTWDNNPLDLAGPAHITLTDEHNREFVFGMSAAGSMSATRRTMPQPAPSSRNSALNLVELRLGRLSKEADAFGKALAATPKQPSLEYGIAPTETRRGDAAKGKAGEQAALAAGPAAAAAADFRGLAD